MTTYTLEVKELPDGDQYIELPEELTKQVGWKEGDTIVWTDLKNGSWSLKKRDTKKIPKLFQKVDND